MNQIPTIERRLRDFGEQVVGMLTLREQEMTQSLAQGVERALRGIGDKVIDEACTFATQKIHEDVKHYLLYGDGGKAIRAAVQHALAPVVDALRTAGGEEEATDDA